MEDNKRKSFLEIEDDLDIALGKIGQNLKIEEKEDRSSAVTVQELLQELKIDEFEKIYITTSVQANSNNKVVVPEEQMGKVKNLAEYQLMQRSQNEEINQEDKEKLKSASNFYLIPHTVSQKYSVGNNQQTKMVDIYTVNDVEGYSLYTVVDENNITISTSFRDRIEKYLEEHYKSAIDDEKISVNEVVEHFTPHNMEELYDIVGDDHATTTRFLPIRIDEFAKQKGLTSKVMEGKEVNLDEYDDLAEENQIKTKEELEEKNQNKSKEDLEQNLEEKNKVVREDNGGITKEDKEEEKEIPQESYIEKIARLNNVKPAVVNTRIIENFEKVEEDTGIRLRGRYQRGEVVAVRIPYKLEYRTFLVDKNTGMTIDGKGSLDRRPGKLYDYDEIEEYFRYRISNGRDGGAGGRPLRYDEGRDYTTYIDEHGQLREEKYINNGKSQDMARDERERYLTEVGEADKRLKDAIDEYQKNSTHDNYKKVKDIIKEKVNIDKKYNALGEQTKITEKTKENVEHVIEKDFDEDDDWYPGSRFFR